MARPPINILAIRSDGQIRHFENLQRPIDMGTLLSEGSYTIYPVGAPVGTPLVVTNGRLEFPWQGFRRATISVPATLTVPAGVNEFWVPVTVDTTRDQSCFVTLGVSNVNGGGINTGNPTQQAAFVERKTWHFCKGDDLLHWVRFIRPAGVTFGNGNAIQAVVYCYGSTQGSAQPLSCLVNFQTGAPAQVVTPTFHRPLRRLNLSAAVRSNSFNPLTLQHHDTGYIGGNPANGPCWRSRLAHGYAQIGNQETGLYMNEDVAAFAPVVQQPITRATDEFGPHLRLRTYAFGSDFVYQGQAFQHQAVMLNGQRMNDVCGSRGVWSMRAITTNRRMAWPAFWTIGRNADTSDAWPPEIDIMEQFNQVYGTDYPMTGFYSTSGQHYGDWGTNNRAGASSAPSRLDLLPGMAGAPSIWAAPHDYACAVNPEANEVTFFYDGVEIGCQRFMARHQNGNLDGQHFPMFNIAVRAPAGYSAAVYNADGDGIMRVYDVAYYPSGWAFDAVTEPWQ